MAKNANYIYQIEGAILLSALVMFHFTGNAWLFMWVGIFMVWFWFRWWRKQAEALRPFVADIPTDYRCAEAYQLDTEERTEECDICGEPATTVVEDDGGAYSYCGRHHAMVFGPEPLEKGFGSEVKNLDDPPTSAY
jgi:hypothetical protein